MNIPNLPFLEKKAKSEYFLSLVLRDEKASAVVFEEITGKINVVGEHQELFKTSLEDATEEELLDVIDKAVSGAEKNLPPDTESQKTIFGVKDTWLSEGKINKDYLAKLKKVSDELEFKPVGFLIISEAVAHLLQKEEGAPVSGILTEIGLKSINISLLKAGRVIESKASIIHETAAFTVDTLLKHFTNSEILPSRIIILNGGSEKLQQEFISHQWSKSLPFLHIPQITNLPSNFDARAVLMGAASQMGFEVLENTLTPAPKEIKAPPTPPPPLDEVELRKKAAGAAIPTEDTTLAELVEDSADFGFSEADVKPKEEKPVTASPETAVADNFSNPSLEKEFKAIPEDVKEKTANKKQFPVQAAMLMGALKGFFTKIPLKLPVNLAAKAAGAPKMLLLLPIIPIVLLVLLLYVYFFMRSAVVTLDINNKEVSKTQNITFAESQNSDPSINLVKAQFISVSEDGKGTTPATGKKQTGDKAKGVITMFNNNDNSVTIPSGTTVTSSNNLGFVTEKEIKIASASGDIFSGTKPGTTNVNVIAEKFGTSYNLPSNTKFSVSGSSSVAAKNDNAFSGGTTKDVKVVSQKDLDKLTKELQEKLKVQAKDDIRKKVSPDLDLLSDFTDTSFERKSFSKKVDDEASEVSLTTTISFEGAAYKKSDMLSFTKDKLKDETGDKLTVNENDLTFAIKNVKKKINKEVSAALDIKAGLIPIINEGDIAKSIAGKSVDDAKAKLSEIPEVKNSAIDLKLALPLLPKRLPFSGRKIKIVINKNG